MPRDYGNERALIEDLARTAGSFLMDHFREEPGLLSLRTSAKEAATRYDKMCDELIIAGIRRVFPGHSILTEESGLLRGDPGWLWIVDSLDGTGDFANWNPFFSVCIALMREGELVLGAVYAPAIDEFYTAEKGGGAYLNGRRMHVSATADLHQSYVFYCEGGERDRQRTGAALGAVYPEVVDIRKLGSAGLETAWVAVGKGEAYFTMAIEPWDVAPGVLLVREAGGRVTDLRGGEWTAGRNDLLFSNGKVHDAMLKLLSPCAAA
ncbi:MAG: inositol monophosphatase family protein [Dehalococcoidia bacterium]|nr:inositol monophosphatase family protein [Dehalococcoidia bacterium]